MRGLLLTFEGPDGAGKTTQLHRMHRFLQSRTSKVMVTREPGGTALGDRIRQLILDTDQQHMTAQTEVLLYAASRAQHVREKILPALEEGYTVLCDRFVDASVAYQGYGLHIGEASIRHINHFATGGLTPDRTYLLDIAPHEARLRLKARGGQLDRIEQRELSYHEQVRQGFHKLARTEDRVLLLDGTQTEEQIHDLIVQDWYTMNHSEG